MLKFAFLGAYGYTPYHQATAELATYCLVKGYSLLKSSTVVSKAKGCLISIPSIKGFLMTGRLWRFLCFKRNSHAGGEGILFATSSIYNIGDQLENLDFVIGLISSWLSCVILDLLGNSHTTYQTANSLMGEFKPFTCKWVLNHMRREQFQSMYI